MKNTLYPEIIYETFERYGFLVLRIDHFDRGNYAEIRAELNHSDYLDVKQLQEITTKLNLMEKNEQIKIHIVNIDMIHKTMRVNIITEE
ncbi:MAG: hypothetical protein KAT17_00600 [Candidatus Aminicenantes bacterium]|nr:hypothetical protein [Candidatus Aminicenantes bacterium]